MLNTFYNCSGLTEVSIPNSVIGIGLGAFVGCSGMTSIIVEKGNTVYDSRDNCNAIIETASNTLIVGCKNSIIPNSVTNIGSSAFSGCSGLTSVTIPNSVISIGNSAFRDCSGLTSVTIPNSVTSIGNYAFSWCGSLASVTSLIEEPFEIDESVFTIYVDNESRFNTATLYVPAGCKKKYEAVSAWNKFENIVEMDIVPVNDGQNVDFNTEIDEETNLDGNIVGDIFYSISRGNGSYNAAEGCLVITKPTNDSDIDGKDIFGEDFKAGYTGIVFKMMPGKGSIKVEAETQGNMVLKVKIGDDEPLVIEFEGKMKVSFPYNVSESSLVYIYGGMGSAGAKATGGTRASSDTDLLKIYGFEVVSDLTGIETIDNEDSKLSDAPIYNLNGQRLETMQKGINIINGKKILVK